MHRSRRQGGDPSTENGVSVSFSPCAVTMPVYIGRPSPRVMRPRTFSTIPATVIGCVVVVLAALAGDSNLPEQNSTSRTPFAPDVATHETQAAAQDMLQTLSADGTVSEIEAVSSAPATRSTFMAAWETVSDADGYLLDVSTNSSFSNYLEGYHDLDVGNVAGRVVTGLKPGITYYYRVRPYSVTGPGSYSEAASATTVPTTGLTIHPTFDSSIIGNANAAAIEAMINRAISIYESLFHDPITIQIRFRYATTKPDGTPLPPGAIALSTSVIYTVPWSTYINSLRADGKTSNDFLANANLPGTALSSNILPRSADGRAVGLNTPPAMFANGSVGQGGPYDGIVTLNSAAPEQFTRPVSAGNFDAQRLTEHEMDEVIGLGSFLGHTGSDIRPQDLFSWSSAGHRNITSSGTRYFSINGGVGNIVNFNQNATGDFGDWLSTACPQNHPFVQNAFTCTGQVSDIAATSPEGVNLDVVGYDLENGPVVATNAATNVASFSATVNGTVHPNGLSTNVHFEYGPTTNYGFTTPNHSYGGNTTQNVSANIAGLTPNTTYHFRIVGTNGSGTSHGADKTFTTLSPTGPPVVRTNPATNVANFSATLHGSLDPHGLTTNVRFQYGTTTAYGHNTPTQSQSGNTFRNIAANISGLTRHTTYHFRITATNSAATRFGSDRIFTTP